MVCIQCGYDTKVINSRYQKRANQVWRRRKCLKCEAVFTTEEVAQYLQSWAVRGLGSSLSPFSRDKLFISIYKSCEHRRNATSDASLLCDTVIKKLSGHIEAGILDSTYIKQVTQVALIRFDRAAGMHYQAYHP